MRHPGSHRANRSLVSATALVALTAGIAGCFTTTADFRNDAEEFIEQNDELRAALFPDTDDSITSATCSEPPNQDEGTTFPCTATDTTGATWEFEIVITGSNEYEVNVARRPDGA
jgi:hypothetical protein